MDRPGGGYVSVPAQDAQSCAALCARDPICMAWSVRAESCELKAVIPAPSPSSGAVSGLSTRAPQFARRLAALDTQVVAASAIGAPTSTALSAPAPVSDAAANEDDETEPLAPADELLGGRLAESDLGIRRRLRP
jgi:hypothetical protein